MGHRPHSTEIGSTGVRGVSASGCGVISCFSTTGPSIGRPAEVQRAGLGLVVGFLVCLVVAFLVCLVVGFLVRLIVALGIVVRLGHHRLGVTNELGAAM